MLSVRAAVCLAVLGLVAGESISGVAESRRHLTGALPNAGVSIGSVGGGLPPIPSFVMSRFKRDVRGLFIRKLPAVKASFVVTTLERRLTPDLSKFFALAFIRAREEFFKAGVILGTDLSGDVTLDLMDSVEQQFRDALLEKFPTFVFPNNFPGVFRVLPDAVFQVIVNSPTVFVADSGAIIALVSSPISSSLIRILNVIEPALPVPVPAAPVPVPVPIGTGATFPVFIGSAGSAVTAGSTRSVGSTGSSGATTTTSVPPITNSVTTTSGPSNPGGVSTVSGVGTVPGPVAVTTVTPTSSNTVTAASTSDNLGSTGSASSSGFTTGGATGLPSVISAQPIVQPTFPGPQPLSLKPFQSGNGNGKKGKKKGP